ncbi:hypothetical protein ACE4MJ_004440 [Escherichia coli]
MDRLISWLFFFVSSCALLFSAVRCVSMVWLALLSRHDCQPSATSASATTTASARVIVQLL